MSKQSYLCLIFVFFMLGVSLVIPIVKKDEDGDSDDIFSIFGFYLENDQSVIYYPSYDREVEYSCFNEIIIPQFESEEIVVEESLYTCIHERGKSSSMFDLLREGFLLF